MKKSENIFVAIQIQRDQHSNGLLLSVQFDKNAPNFSIENEMISWCPTVEEIDFIEEAFTLMTGHKTYEMENKEIEITLPSSEIKAKEIPYHSTESRIAVLPEETAAKDSDNHISQTFIKKKESAEKIFVQADEKTIDEVLKRKKTSAEEEIIIESGEKTLIDKVLRQKKKKE
jgi:hypothetical protein